MESFVGAHVHRAATESAAAVEKWRRQRRTLERMPSHLAEALLRTYFAAASFFLLLEVFKYSVEEIDLRGMANLKEVDLSRCSKITDAGIRHLLSIPALEKLCISQTGVTADGVAGLASLTNLFMLDLGGLPVTDSALSSLQVLKKLKHLDLWGSEISNEGAVLLKTFRA
ncbi:UNVERIFIED_CONTAM: hypothetical protein Sangu_1655200 [Sesamum angustifolium]|uniref:Uncharacterized protein n=1 Tax=Sesamum angustifolium TaxID=2727405 RepID=A0AAW2MHW3_9LAMI